MGMEKINDPALLGQIMAAAVAQGIDPALVLALIEIESGCNPFMTQVEATQRANLLFQRPEECSPEMETLSQKTRWGLMQIRGSVARSLGFDGWLPQLAEPLFNVEIGAKYLKQLTERFGERHGIEGVIAAYHTEAPRKIGDKFVNQAYVDEVLGLMKSYQPFVKEILESVMAEEIPSVAVDTTDVPALADVPVVDHTLETLNALAKAQLAELLKTEYGIDAAANATKAKLIEQILVAQAEALEITASDLEGQEGHLFCQRIQKPC